ncbi:hypothetical protein D3C78_1047740 [compost metagenome]
MAERHHRIHFRIIACGRPLRDIVFDGGETLNEVSVFIFWADAVNIDAITILQAALRKVVPVHEDDVPSAEDAAITVIHAIDRRIVLIVTADRGQHEGFRIGDERVFLKSCGDKEIGLAALRVPAAEGGRDIKAKAAFYPNPAVEIPEIGKDLFDLVTDPVVIGNQPIPVYSMAAADCRFGDARDDGRLRPDQLPGRVQETARGMHHRHRVLDCHGLRAQGLGIQIGASKAGQDQRYLRCQKVRAVEFCCDVNGEIEVAHALEGRAGIRHGDGEVSAKTD